jgi:hypothetical protein
MSSRIVAVLVVTAVLIAGVWADNADTDTEEAVVSEDFVSGSEAVHPATVQSLQVAMNPDSVVVAKTVAHLSNSRSAGEAETESQGESDADETEAEAAGESAEGRDPGTLYSSRFTQVHADPAAPAAPPAPAKSSSPIQQLKGALTAKSSSKGAKGPGMDTDPIPPKGGRANSYPQPGTPFQPMKVMHHLGGLEDAPAAGTVSMEAGDELPADFDAKKEAEKKCPGGCSRKLPIVIGTGGHNERPAKDMNRRVKLPTDHAMWKRIHNDLKTSERISWQQLDLNNGRRKLRSSTRIIDALTKKRKALEINPLGRRVFT